MMKTVEQKAIDCFRDFISRQLGLYFENGKLDRLADVLQDRVRRTNSTNVSRYLEALESPRIWKAEAAALAAGLTVGETYFFRHADQFHAFAEAALPERVQAQAGRRRLRLLSAGCASGEEPYSLAVLLNEALPDTARWDVRVIGIDVNTALLEKARRGRYTAWSLRGLAGEKIRRYFRAAGKEYVLNDAVRKLVSFEARNLIEEDSLFWLPEEFDAIFCRNVTMYFTPEATRIVIARLTRSLARGGFLFLGPAETLRGVSQDYHLRHTHETFCYQRRLAGETTAYRGTEAAAAQVSEILLPAAESRDESWVDAICQASERIARLSQEAATKPRPIARSAVDSSSDRKVSPVGKAPSRIDIARSLLHQERFEDLLQTLGSLSEAEREDPDAQLLYAVVLTNRGRVGEAEQICQQVLAGDELNAEAHFLLALCREHAGEYREAIELEQMAIYLDSRFAMPHVHLGLLAKRIGDLETARHAFLQGSSLLPSEEASRILLFGGGFRREALMQLCQAELRACGGLP